MTRMMAILMVAGMCSACVNTDANLKRETARFVGDVTPEDVTVAEVDRGMTNVDWQASTPKGYYRCSADDMLRRVNCVKR